MGAEVIERPTVRLTNIPLTITATHLLNHLETQLGPDSVYAIEIVSDHKNWKSRGFGRVQFTTLDFKLKAQSLSLQNKLIFKSQNLKISETYDDIIARPVNPKYRVDNGVLHAGFLKEELCLTVLESWDGVRMWVMPERRRVEFWIWVDQDCFKVDISFDNILETVRCCLEGDTTVNATLFKLKYGPRIYKKKYGPDVVSKFSADRYHLCKEDFDFIWIRTTDFSSLKSIGQSTSFCWQFEEGLDDVDIYQSFPYHSHEKKHLDLEDGEEWGSTSEIVPLVRCDSDSTVAYEILFQLNSLVHNQKISLAAVDADLFKILGSLSKDTALVILQKLHKLAFTCYDPLAFIKKQLLVPGRNLKRPLPSSNKNSTSHNIMSCHRALVTPSKIYCLGPELESSNYVVKNYASYASDFMRVTFVDEDWNKLPVNAISASIQQGIFAKPFRTEIYRRILSILQDGIVIGAKKFEFLAFSASQLRSSSVWMFASNDKVKAEDIREWMGCFNKIRSISKCAARMGQLFSSSKQTFIVPSQDVEVIPDIEVTSDGIDYCFSDGIGKISLSFARQVAQKCGLNKTPSAFQIRYGGYKGVIAVDPNSFRKLSLRASMLKFESDNRMLNVTKWTESMPCYMNREIVTLLTTLGVKDEVLEGLLQRQLHLLGRMLSGREAALNVLENLTWANSKNILVKMLLQGYEPDVEPYLSMMLRAYHENLLLELRTKCRIFVPRGRILVGCLDETGILDYGQVYVRITMTKTELQSVDQSFFRKVDETTAVVTGKVVVTKNPCLHPGDIRVLDAVYEVELEEKGSVDCILFPQKGERPHPNECSGGDLDGDQFFISWDEGLVPSEMESPMNYQGRRPRIMDHNVTLEEIHKFFVDYMINDTLGAISTAHLVHADFEPEKARSTKCLQLADLHSMAVDFAKTGAPAEMPKALKPKEFPDFMERNEKKMYISEGVLGKLYRNTLNSSGLERSKFVWTEQTAETTYDRDLEVEGFTEYIEIASTHKEMYAEKLSGLMDYYEAKSEDEILTGNLRDKAMYLQRDNRRYGDTKDRILISVKNLQKEAKEWFESSCEPKEQRRLASAWYHVTYHPSYYQEGMSCLSFPWILADILLNVKSANSKNNSSTV
ncbi:RNA-dependent RNA polymerase 2 [Mercurialis annua]|uniref:RNA-dependent RNA polymerase 2 n=1 Tax=Mercurialis annua TaxID=3986 RepID=UPI00215F2FCE|nr:RNA-dependent RNA polymerase 2 [Mercurialis annua]